jgi:hypothetical protein
MEEHHTIRGFPVRVTNTRPDIETAHVLESLTRALDLIATYAPRRFRRMRQDLAGFVVQRFPCRGAFFPAGRECLVELTFTVNPRHTTAEIAASIVHEATHARVASAPARNGSVARPSWSWDSRYRMVVWWWSARNPRSGWRIRRLRRRSIGPRARVASLR